MFNRRARATAVLVLAGSLVLAACGDDEDLPASSGDPITTTTEATTTTEPSAVAVTGIDYAFEGLPDEVAAGTTFTFTNGSDKEAHELILVRVKDDATVTVEEMLALPSIEEALQYVDLKGVAVAGPGEDGAVVNGSLVADEAGRYVALCTFQVGRNPADYVSATEPVAPDPNAGPPHFTEGMVREFEVK